MNERVGTYGHAAPQDETRCMICDGESVYFDSAVVLKRHRVRYFACSLCGFVQTEEPYWLAEAYSSAIAEIDVGPLDRALGMAEKTMALAVTLLNPWAPCLDYGGGYGLLVRRMRDLGLDFRYYDLHCENLFAKGFEGDPFGGERFELITAFEVIEHLRDPVEDVGRLLGCTSNIFFSTEVLPAHRPGPNDWWYYAPDSGQHISIFSRESLAALAKRLDMRLLSRGRLHLLTRKRVPPAFFSLLLRDGISGPVGRWLGSYRGIGSRLRSDFKRGSGLTIDS